MTAMTVVLVIAGFACLALLVLLRVSGDALTVGVVYTTTLAAACFMFLLATGWTP